MSLNAIVIIPNHLGLRNQVIHQIKNINGTIQELTQIPVATKWNGELIICHEDLLDVNIFKTNINLVEAIEKLNVLFLIIGNTIQFKFKPINVKVLKNETKIKKDIDALIGKWLIINEKRNNREKVIANKLNRLMYILRELDVKEELFMEEIIKVTGVSKRTVLRDLKFLREMLIDKEIVFDEYQGSYIMNDLL
jgi:hypothetical protein